MTKRGFDRSEFEARLHRAQDLMNKADISALLLTTEPEVRYFTGYLTRFWESPTRPWFLVVPVQGNPTAIIPSIGVELMGQTWIEDIRSWASPDLKDDGISLLCDTLRDFERIGTPMGPETHLRMPLADFERLRRQINITHDTGIMRTLRMIKSPAEVKKIHTSAQIAGNAFARVGEFLRPGLTFSETFRLFQMLCLEEGADFVPYLAGGFGPDGYGDVISPATDAPLSEGDIVMLDTGLIRDGYFCDFDRNFAIGGASQAAQDGYKRLIEATDEAFEVAAPGKTTSDLFHVMDKILGGSNDAGRLGHGLGMQLTEWPSLTAQDHTELTEGMVLTLEPGIATTPGQVLVHEENILITATGAQMLSPAAARDLPIIG